MEEIAGNKAQVSDFAYLTTLDEVLLTTIGYLEVVRRAPDYRSQKFNLSMASHALCCALKIYLDRAEQKEVK